ncbi:MAG: amidohydrolase family protein [Phycisphaerae bacterium]
MTRIASSMVCVAAALASFVPPAQGQIAIRGNTVYTMAGPSLRDGVVIVRDGKIAAVGPAASTPIPDGFRTLTAAVVTPGLVDAHATVGLTGLFNYSHDQDQLERSNPVQPELRAIDAYNPQEPLVAWVRSFGVTTVHTGHAPGELISGQTAVVKTTGKTVEDAVVVDAAAVAVTLGPGSLKGGKPPGTRGKQVAMLRAELIKARDYAAKQPAGANQPPAGEAKSDAPTRDQKPDAPARDLKLEALARVLRGELPLLVTAHRAQDIASVLRLAREFQLRIWLDGAAESYLLIDEIKAAGVPVIVHPTMQRAYGEAENLSFETAAKLRAAGIPIAIQSGYEGYVPKVRVVLFEAAAAARYGLSFDHALSAVTIDAARILGVEKRVGSLEVGKDADLALYDGDPFEYTTHCTGVVIDGEVVSEIQR